MYLNIIKETEEDDDWVSCARVNKTDEAKLKNIKKEYLKSNLFTLVIGKNSILCSRTNFRVYVF